MMPVRIAHLVSHPIHYFAPLYRDLARLRTEADGVPIRQRHAEDLRWDGTPRDAWEAFCDEWGMDRLRRRPHRWLDEA